MIYYFYVYMNNQDGLDVAVYFKKVDKYIYVAQCERVSGARDDTFMNDLTKLCWLNDTDTIGVEKIENLTNDYTKVDSFEKVYTQMKDEIDCKVFLSLTDLQTYINKNNG